MPVLYIRDDEGNFVPIKTLKGEPGKTPERGKEYWTEEDKQKIIEDVLSQVGTGGGSSGGSDPVESGWKIIAEGAIAENVPSIVINANADGVALNDLDVSELLIIGTIKLTADSKVRFEFNGLWTSGNYAVSDSKLGAWVAAFAVHVQRAGNGMSTRINVEKESRVLFAEVASYNTERIKGFELHTEDTSANFASDKTVICAYYK